MTEEIYGKKVYVNLDEVIETVYQCRRDVADEEWEKRWLEPLMGLQKIDLSEDAISRKYLLDKANSGFDKLVEDYDINHMLRDIKDAPSVIPKRSCYRCGLREDCEDSTERKPKEGEWIPCSERLPEEEGHYLVTFGAFAETINGEIVIFGDPDGSVAEIGYGCYERDIFWQPIAFGWYDLYTATPFDKRAIIAWMSLPEPWKGVDNV